MLRQYFSCNERLEIFLTCFCNNLCYVGTVFLVVCYSDMKNQGYVTINLTLSLAHFLPNKKICIYCQQHISNNNIAHPI